MTIHRFESAVPQFGGLPSNPFGYEPRPWMFATRDAVMNHLKACSSAMPGHLIAIVLSEDVFGNLVFTAASDQIEALDPWFVPTFYDSLPDLAPIPVDDSFLLEAEDLRRSTLGSYLKEKAAYSEHKHQRGIKRQHGADSARLDEESRRESLSLNKLRVQYKNALAAENQAKERLQKKLAQAQRHYWLKRLSHVTADNGTDCAALDRLLEDDIENELLLKSILRTGLPALLDHAVKNHLNSLDWGCFWFGPSPESDIRQEGEFYAFPRLRHDRLLKYFLAERPLEPNPLSIDRFADWVPSVLFEDEFLIAIEKPAGLLSVPGKGGLTNALQKMLEIRPEMTGPVLLHRLDMSTSGVLIFAKDKETHLAMQRVFENRQVHKSYEALIEKEPHRSSGVISLPLCPNPYDTPRQMVDRTYGRESLTQFKVISSGGPCRVILSPVTGRSHQLRVHCAHPAGLGSPILGDELYGHRGPRLMLHAKSIVFEHPATQKEIRIISEAPF